MKHILPAFLLACLCLLFGVAFAANSGQHPCEKETAALMDISSSWSQIYSAAQVMPNKCFDGGFAEGISDVLVRKVGQDWPGFISLVQQHENDKRFFPLVLRSINGTVNPADVAKIKNMAEHSCPASMSSRCAKILRTINAEFGEYFRHQGLGA